MIVFLIQFFFTDMINMMKFSYVPQCVEWIYSPGDAVTAVAVSDQDSPKIFIYDGLGTETPLHVLEKLHLNPVVALKVLY